MRNSDETVKPYLSQASHKGHLHYGKGKEELRHKKRHPTSLGIGNFSPNFAWNKNFEDTSAPKQSNTICVLWVDIRYPSAWPCPDGLRCCGSINSIEKLRDIARFIKLDVILIMKLAVFKRVKNCLHLWLDERWRHSLEKEDIPFLKQD